MITELTEEQKNLMPLVRDQWIGLLDTCPKPNREQIIAGVNWLYGLIGLPAPLIVIVDSPLGGQFAYRLLKNSASVRASVWDSVKASVGDYVWASVGDSVGASVRDSVRDSVWDSVGASVKDSVRDSVGASVRDSVGASVRDSVKASVGDSVRASVWDSVKASVGDSVRDYVWASVWASVGDSVGDSVKDSVGASVRDSVKASVGASVRDYQSFSYYGNISDFGWVALYDFFERIGVELKTSNFAPWKSLLTSGVYDMLQYKNVCIVCCMPAELHRREPRGPLHCETGPAIKWSDGYELYRLHGVSFEPELYWSIVKRTATSADILGISNIEQRMAALRVLGADYALVPENSTKLHTSILGHELYEVREVVPNTTHYALKYRCPSTQRLYVSFVPPEVGESRDSDVAMAWKFGVSKKQYLAIEKHT